MRQNRHQWRIPIKPQNKFPVLLLAAVILTGCSREEPKKDFVARVNDSYLTRSDIEKVPGAGSKGKFFRSEYVRSWIRREVLFQAAQREGLLDEAEFKKIVEDSRKELAAAMMVNKFFEEESFIYEPKEVEAYYSNSKDIFRLTDDGYLYNTVSFNDEDKAVRFRLTVIESDWNKALNAFKGDSSLRAEQSRKLNYEYEVHPAVLLRMLKELYPQEVSIVLETEPGNFLVAQLVEKYNKGTIPPFETIKHDVEKSYLAERKEILLDDYLKELYSNNEIEVKGSK